MTIPAVLLASDSEDDYMTDSSEHSHDAYNNAISDSEPTTLLHPFAASTKAHKALPLYEKKSITPPLTPKEPSSVITPRTHVCSHKGRSLESASGGAGLNSPVISDERERWASAIAAAVDKATTTVDLSGSNLTYIPSSVMDLNRLVILPKPENANVYVSAPRTFRRSSTAPALLPSPEITDSRKFAPSLTMGKLAFGSSKQFSTQISSHPLDDTKRHMIQLFLSQNSIRQLPRELFTLSTLVVLSLRANKLTSLPPGIGRLSSLRELNIANNRMKFLPSEIQNLTLATLQLHPNPFLPYPLSENENPLRVLGPIKRSSVSSVPTLSELALRTLLRPTDSELRDHRLKPTTRLEEAMSVSDIDGLHLPEHVQHIIRASTGHERSRRDEPTSQSLAEDDVTMNICPNRQHCHFTPLIRARSVHFSTLENEPSRAVFHTPIEERVEWVGKVAGVQIAESRLGWIPIQWRGCSHACLDFLEEKERVKEKSEKAGLVVGFETSKGEDGDEFEFSDEE